jgi:MFS transporter, putative metabolite:H+ symporter
MAASFGRPPRGATVPMVEHLTLIVGLLFCVTTWVLFAAGRGTAALAAAAPADFVATFNERTHLAEMLALPLGLGTTGIVLLALLRLWDTGARRVRLRLLTVILMFALLIVDLLVMDPIEHRMLAAVEADAAAFTAELARLGQWEWLRLLLTVGVATTLVLAHRAPMPVVAEVSASGMTSRHRTLLLLVGTATLFEGYDRFITSLALPYIGNDLGAGEGALGTALAVIRAGALASIFLGRLADRYGRRRLLIISVVAYTAATAATGFSTGLLDFALFQLVATIFLVTELSLAQVVIAEEFPPALRGFGQGALGAFAAFGAGLAAMLFPLMQRTEFGWRGMYLIGVLPLLVVAYLRRNLPETRRWQRAIERRVDEGRIADLLRPGVRRRLLVLTALAAFASATAATAFSFASYRATTSFHFTPSQVTGMIIGGGTVGFFGYFLFGRAADAIGRRLVGCLGLAGAGFAVVLFYQTEWLIPAFALMTLCESGVVIALNALTTEMFPTHLRATAKSWVTNSGVVGALLGLAMIGALNGIASGAAVITTLSAMTSLLAPLIFLLPETHRLDLEQVDILAAGAR